MECVIDTNVLVGYIIKGSAPHWISYSLTKWLLCENLISSTKPYP